MSSERRRRAAAGASTLSARGAARQAEVQAPGRLTSPETPRACLSHCWKQMTKTHWCKNCICMTDDVLFFMSLQFLRVVHWEGFIVQLFGLCSFLLRDF